MSCCSGELLPELVPLRVVEGKGEPRAPLGPSCKQGELPTPPPGLDRVVQKGLGVLPKMHRYLLFSQAVFGCCICCLPAAVGWWHREAVNGKAPAGLPLCVLSLGKLPLSSCSVSFCGSHLVSTIIPSGHGEMCHLEDIRPRSQQVLG